MINLQHLMRIPYFRMVCGAGWNVVKYRQNVGMGRMRPAAKRQKGSV